MDIYFCHEEALAVEQYIEFKACINLKKSRIKISNTKNCKHAYIKEWMLTSKILRYFCV